MTTSRSPLRKLVAQADKIAMELKRLERGEVSVADPAGKVAAARMRKSITAGVVMDDKIVKLEIDWDLIRSSSEASLSAWIVKHMQGGTTEH